MMKKELTLPAVVENIEAVTYFANEFMDEIGCPMKIQMHIAVVIDEVFSNISFYAYPSSKGEATVTVETIDRTHALDAEPLQSKKALVLTFLDHGIAYNPLDKDDPNITLSTEERELGGLGIFMTKKLMDEVFYEYRDSQNIFKLTKYYE